MSDPTIPTSPLPEPASGPAATPPIPPPPAPAQSTTAPDAPAAPPAVAGTGLAPNVAAALASFFLLFGGIVFLLVEKKDQFVRFYAMQSVFLGGLWVAVSIGVAIVYAMLHGILFIGVLLGLVSILIRLVLFVIWLVMVFKAFTNKEWEIPYLGKLAREQLAKMNPTAP
jgi:uncharacterized membrane protein